MSASKKWFAFMATMLFCAQSALADVVAAWNFNALVDSVPALLVADNGHGGLSLADFSGGLSSLVGTDVNAVSGVLAGQALTVTGLSQNTKSLVIDVDTQGVNQLQFSMAARRSSSGFSSLLVQVWNGQLWKDVGAISASTTQWQSHSLDLSSYTFIDNGSLRLRVQFSGATSSSGNARIDNLRVDGNLIPAPGAIVAIGAAATLGVRRGTRTNATEAQRPQSTQSETTPALDKEPAKIRAKKITKKPK